MECVFEKMGIGHGEFGNPDDTGAAAERIHLYRGGANSGTPPGSGARINDQTPHDSVLYGALPRLEAYDMIVADCEGATWDSSFANRDAYGDSVRDYLNRGGRMFASHLSFSWLHENGTQAYAAADPVNTGLGPAGTWATNSDNSNTGTGVVSLGRPNASPRIQNFADWTVQEKVLLYMLFDLGACVGDDPPPPPCVPIACGEDRCGFAPDGCGAVLDCGPCRPPA